MRMRKILQWEFRSDRLRRIKDDYFLTKQAYLELKRRFGIKRANRYRAHHLKFHRMSVRCQEKFSPSL